MPCPHNGWRIIYGRERRWFWKWVLLREREAYNYKDGHRRQRISAWCADCGALKIDGEWVFPKLVTKQNTTNPPEPTTPTLNTRHTASSADESQIPAGTSHGSDINRNPQADLKFPSEDVA